MTNGSGANAGKSLKDQNRWQIWLVVAVNSLFLYGLCKQTRSSSWPPRGIYRRQ